MKKILVIFLFIFSRAHGQSWPPVDTFGTWGYITATQGNYNIFNNYVSSVKGFHITINWAYLKPTASGNYRFDSLLLMVDSAVARGKWVGIQTMVGQNSPHWIFDSCGSFTTIGGAVTGPYPKYYNPKYIAYYYQFLHDFGHFLDTLSGARKSHLLYWQIAEGSTGDEQPYKGILDPAGPYIHDPYVPQDKFELQWDTYRKLAWDTIAMSSEYAAISHQIYLMFNSGNDGSNVDYVYGDSTMYDNTGYINGHFAFLPLQPFMKEGEMSHLYGFRGAQSYYNRVTAPSRGELQGYLKNTIHPNKDLFMLVCSALTGGLKMFNIDQGWPGIESGGTPRYITDFFSKMTTTTSEGFSMPSIQLDGSDSITYPVSIYGPVINPAQTTQFTRAIYNYGLQAAQTGGNQDYVEWQYIRALDKYINPSRITAIHALYPSAHTGNQTDSMYWNDIETNNAPNYQKNLYQLKTLQTVLPLWRVGPDTSFYGRFAGKPKLVSNKCTWYYDVDPKIINSFKTDSLEIDITYLQNNSGGSFSVSVTSCGKKTVSDATTVTNNSGQWATKTVIIPNMPFKKNGYDFMIDFTGSVTIGFVQVKNLSK